MQRINSSNCEIFKASVGWYNQLYRELAPYYTAALCAALAALGRAAAPSTVQALNELREAVTPGDNASAARVEAALGEFLRNAVARCFAQPPEAPGCTCDVAELVQRFVRGEVRNIVAPSDEPRPARPSFWGLDDILLCVLFWQNLLRNKKYPKFAVLEFIEQELGHHKLEVASVLKAAAFAPPRGPPAPKRVPMPLLLSRK